MKRRRPHAKNRGRCIEVLLWVLLLVMRLLLIVLMVVKLRLLIVVAR